MDSDGELFEPSDLESKDGDAIHCALECVMSG